MIDRQALLHELARQIAGCKGCALCHTRRRTVPGHGVGDASVVFVGEAPGGSEDKQGLPFVGRSGQFLKKLLRETEGDPRWCFIVNVLKCRPPANRAPTDEEMEKCSEWLWMQLDIIRPKIVVCVGKTAARAILECKKTASMNSLRGQWHERDWWGPGFPLVRVIFHPSFLLQHGRDQEEASREDLREIWTKARELAA